LLDGQRFIEVGRCAVGGECRPLALCCMACCQFACSAFDTVLACQGVTGRIVGAVISCAHVKVSERSKMSMLQPICVACSMVEYVVMHGPMLQYQLSATLQPGRIRTCQRQHRPVAAP
jgi:hypothetical protein